MNSPITQFYNRVKSVLGRESDLPDFFAYYLTVQMALPAATVKGVRECYEACDLAPPSWLPSHFSKGLNKPRRYIKLNGGYRLENRRREQIAASLDEVQAACQTSAALNDLRPRSLSGPSGISFTRLSSALMPVRVAPQ